MKKCTAVTAALFADTAHAAVGLFANGTDIVIAIVIGATVIGTIPVITAIMVADIVTAVRGSAFTSVSKV